MNKGMTKTKLRCLDEGAPFPCGLSLLASISSFAFSFSANFSYKRVERIVDSHARFGRRLNERNAVIAGHVLRSLHVHGPSRQVAFVADQHHRHVVRVFHSLDLFAVHRNVLERLGVVDGEHEQKAFAGAHVLVSHRTVLFLAGRVENVEQARFTVDHYLFSIRVFDRRVVFVHKMILSSEMRLENSCHSFRSA